MGHYPPGLERVTSSLLRDIVLSRNENGHTADALTSKGKGIILLMERARKRAPSGKCSEQRCLRNFHEFRKSIARRFARTHSVHIFGPQEPVVKTVGMFSKADVVIGIHGAGFQNVAFCRKNTTVVHVGFANNYGSLAKQFELKYHSIIVPGLKRSTVSYTVPIVDVVAQIEKAMIEDGLIRKDS